jgi:hypothetical protein
MQPDSLFHISDDPKIKMFGPRPSPWPIEGIDGDVVFAISGRLLHNYILPRDCPRVTFYGGPGTSLHDREKFFGSSTADYVIAVENGWFKKIQQTTLYCYEFPPDHFSLIDACAEYFVSYEPVIPLAVKPIYNILESLLQRNIELRFLPAIDGLADEVRQSTLRFSLIRMRNALVSKPVTGKI